MRVHGTAQLLANMALQHQPGVSEILAKKKKRKEPKNLKSVKWNENHLFTVHTLGWKETVARDPKERKGRPPYLTPPAENLATDLGFALCSLHW